MAAHDYRAFWSGLKQPPLAPAYYFFGSQDILKDEALASLVERALDPAQRAFNLDQRAAGSLAPDEVATLCTTLPMLGERRVVVIREVEAWRAKAKTKAAILRYLDSPSPETVLVLIQGAGEREGDSELLARTYAVALDDLREDHARRWLTQRAQRLGLALTADATTHLLTAVEGDLGSAASELDKLAGLVGEGEVTVAHLETVLGVRHGETPADWRDALLADDPRRAAAILPYLLAQPSTSGVKLVTLLGTSLVGLDLVRACYDRGQRDGQLERAVRGRLPRYPIGGFNAQAAVAAWARWVPRWPPARIRAAIQAALTADQSLKTTTISDEEGVLTDLTLALAWSGRTAA